MRSSVHPGLGLSGTLMRTGSMRGNFASGSMGMPSSTRDGW